MQPVVPSSWEEGSGVAKREEGAMRGAQRRGKRKNNDITYYTPNNYNRSNLILLYHP